MGGPACICRSGCLCCHSRTVPPTARPRSHPLPLQLLAQTQPGRGGGAPAGKRKEVVWQRKARSMLAASGLLEEEEGGQAEAAEEGTAVDLPRLYEHFMFAMAHKGQFAGGRGRGLQL